MAFLSFPFLMLESWWIRRFYTNAGIDVPVYGMLTGNILGLKLLRAGLLSLTGLEAV